MKSYDVIVIGSGISSLTCATILSQRGMSVCVLEQYKKPGGYLHSFKRFNLTYETGAHYVGAMDPGQPFHTLLNYLGVYDSELFVPLDPDGFDEFHFPSFNYAFPKGYPAVVASLQELFPEEAQSIGKYFAMMADVVKHFHTYNYSLEMDVNKLIGILDTSLEKVVREHVRDPRLQAILFGHCYLHGVEPCDISFGLHALVLDSMIQGPYGFRVGGDSLANRFVKRIEAAGGVVRMGVGVTRLHTSGGEVSSYSAVSNGALRRPRRRSITPASPKSAHGFPVAASSSRSRASTVAATMRRRQGSPAARVRSSQVETPRLA